MVVSIKEKLLKIKSLGSLLHEKEHYALAVLLVLVSAGGFASGRLSLPSGTSPQGATALHPTMRALPGHASSTEQGTTATSAPDSTPQIAPTQASSAKVAAKGVYVGSRKGNKYHLPSCAGAQHISAANKVWFASKEEAASKGYTPASNCKGI